MQRASDRLHIIVSDDGVGGADPARGTGLAACEARRVGGRNLRDRQPARRADPARGGPAMRTVATPGQWIWRASGLITAAVLVFVGAHLITRAGQPEQAQPQSHRGPDGDGATAVTSLPCKATAPRSSHGRDRPPGRDHRNVYLRPPGRAGRRERGAHPGAVGGRRPPASPAGAPSAPAGLRRCAPVAQSMSGGHLSLADPACDNSGCSVSFAMTVPPDVTATVTTDGGPAEPSAFAGLPGNPGWSAERHPYRRLLTVITDGGSLQLDGLACPLNADTGGGPLIAQGITSATATVTTDGGNARLAFAAAPDTVTVSTEAHILI